MEDETELKSQEYFDHLTYYYFRKKKIYSKTVNEEVYSKYNFNFRMSNFSYIHLYHRCTLSIGYFKYLDGDLVAESIKLVCKVLNYQVDEEVISLEDFDQNKEQYILNPLPLFVVKNKKYNKNLAILKQIGRITGSYPKNYLDCLTCDEICEEIEEVIQKIHRLKTFERKKFQKEHFKSKFIPYLLEHIECNNSKFIINNSINICDVMVFCVINLISASKIEGFPSHMLPKNSRINDQVERLCSDSHIMSVIFQTKVYSHLNKKKEGVNEQMQTGQLTTNIQEKIRIWNEKMLFQSIYRNAEHSNLMLSYIQDKYNR